MTPDSTPNDAWCRRRVVCIKVDESIIESSGRNRFSKMSLKWVGPTVGKRVRSDEITGERGVGLPAGATVARPEAALPVGRHSLPCLMIRLSRTSIWSAGSVAARVEARALPAVVTSDAAGAGGSGPHCEARGVAGFVPFWLAAALAGSSHFSPPLLHDQILSPTTVGHTGDTLAACVSGRPSVVW